MSYRGPWTRGLAGALLLHALAVLPVSAQSSVSSMAGWPTSSPQQQGLEIGPLQEFARRAAAREFGNVDRIVVVRNGVLVVNERFDPDYRALSRGQTSPIGCGFESCTTPADSNEFNYLHPAWHPWYQGRRVHTLQSVTKSVTAALIGIALGRRQIASVDTPLLSFFNDYDLSRVDPRLRKATLADLLTMRSGIEWHETDRPLDDTNTTLQLEKSRDWIRFTLAQPMDAEPGTKWAYSSGGSQLMAQVIRAATGQHADAFAREQLFTPLGIRDFHWKKTPTGHPDTEGGLYLEAEDLAKIGQLYLDGGTWHGRSILPGDWVAASIRKHAENVNPAGYGYGYQWWRTDRRGTDVWAGLGFGGQFLVVVPQYRIVGVLNSWNVFGGPFVSPFAPFLDALLAAAGAAL